MRCANKTERRQPIWNRIEIRLQLKIIMLAVVYLDITDNWRPTPGLISKRKRRDGIERCENVALPRHQRPSKSRIEVVLGRQAPSEKFFSLAVTAFAEESLRDAGFDFAGVCNCVVFVKTNNSAEIPDSG